MCCPKLASSYKQKGIDHASLRLDFPFLFLYGGRTKRSHLIDATRIILNRHLFGVVNRRSVPRKIPRVMWPFACDFEWIF